MLMKKLLQMFLKKQDMIQPHMENGIMVCKPLITQIQEVLMTFMDSALVTGEIILTQS